MHWHYFSRFSNYQNIRYTTVSAWVYQTEPKDLMLWACTKCLLSLPADEPAPPHYLKSRIVECQTNGSTIQVTWEPSNGSRVDFYHYQFIDYLTDIPLSDSNTTNTTVVLSGIPCSINILSFVISAHNCEGESTRVTILIGK